MARACTYAPTVGTRTYYELKKDLGYNLAWDVWSIAASRKFKDAFSNSLNLDEDGIPDYQSVMGNKYIQSYIHDNIDRQQIEKGFQKRDDTFDNYNLSINDAVAYNKNGQANDRFVAVVDISDGKQSIKLLDRTSDNVNIAYNQAATHQLNQRLADILAPVGITYSMLSQMETDAGRAGVTDFTAAKQIASDAVNLIRVANNMEGDQALSEEFCHVIVRALQLKNNPLLQRVRNLLTGNEDALRKILGDDYNDIVSFQNGDMDKVVEEAMGQLLRKNLSSQIQKEQQPVSHSLIDRLINFIKSLFRKLSPSSIADAVGSAEGIMSSLAANILDNTSNESKSIRATKAEDLASDDMFNSLSNRIERNLELLKLAVDTETKRYKIVGGEGKTSKEIAQNIRHYRDYNEQMDTTIGVLEYAYQALTEYRQQEAALKALDSSDAEDKFRILRSVRMTIQSYAPVIKKLNQMMIAEEDEEKEAQDRKNKELSDETYRDAHGLTKEGDERVNPELDEEDKNDFIPNITISTPKGDVDISVSQVINELNVISQRLAGRFEKVSVPAFVEFLRPILDDDIMELVSKKAGRKVSIDELLKSADGDISMFDYFLDSMADSSNILLQAFDRVVKDAKNKARLRSISMIKRIQALQKKAESLGMTSYDWMFERYEDGTKTGNYISAVNNAQYDKDYMEFLDYLDEKYGKNPGTKEEVKAKLKEKDEWINDHTDPDFPFITPHPKKYENKVYTGLPQEWKDFVKEFLDLKAELDNLYPENKVDRFKAVQIRKDGVQRFIDSAKSPSSIISNIKEHLKEEFIRQEDSDQEFGNLERKGLTDFDGREFMVLPVLYTNNLKNPDELSTDIFGSLIAYSVAAHEFDELSNVIDPLEIGKNIVLDNLQVQQTSGNSKMVEQFSALGNEVKNKIFKRKGASNIEKRLENFFRSQVYHRYLADQGTVAGVDVNKATSVLLRVSSQFQLGFNFLANLANVTNGIAMQNIEAAAGEWFTFKELLDADRTYVSLLPEFFSQLGKRAKSNKLDCFDEFFNVRHVYDKTAFNSQRKSLLARIFGENLLFIGQEAGDHWLYNRSAIALAKKTKVILNDNTTSLWKVFDTRAVEGNEDIREGFLPEGLKNEDGSDFNVSDFIEKLSLINRQLFGNYNTDDMNVAHSYALGRMMMLYRAWIKPQFNKRFQSSQVNLATHQMQEGYYVTLWKIAKELKRAKFQIGAVWNDLDDSQRKNVRRAVFEIAQLFAIWLLTQISWSDDKNKRPWAKKLARYMTQRTWHEAAVFVPTFPMVEEGLKTLKSPTPCINTISVTYNMIHSMFSPEDWTQEVQSGRLKGMTKLEANIYKAPLPGLMQYRQIDRFMGDLDPLTDYLARPYSGY